MGNYRFRLSYMMPNVWFYKLKDMGRARNRSSSNTRKKQNPVSPASNTAKAQPSKIKQPHQFYPRKSYYFTRELIPADRFYASPAKTKSIDHHFPDPPRKSSKQRSRKINTRSSPKLVASSLSSSFDDSSLPQEFRSDCILTTESFDNMVSLSRSCSWNVMNSKSNDIVNDADNKLSELKLPPINTKAAKFNDMVKGIENKEPTKYRSSLSVKDVKEERITVKEKKNISAVRKFTVNSPGVRLRINSPRIASRRIHAASGRKSVSSSSRRSLSGSFAVVKSSFDPQRDFRDSMVEMIMENNIRASKDLEDLLACYLSLNSDEYHDVIIKVFKQIWFDLSDVRMK